jgi:hypothetical protein
MAKFGRIIPSNFFQLYLHLSPQQARGNNISHHQSHQANEYPLKHSILTSTYRGEKITTAPELYNLNQGYY